MNCTNVTTTLNCCLNDNVAIVSGVLIITFISFVFNVVSCSFWGKFNKDRKRRKKRILAIREARKQKRKKFSDKNLEYQRYIKSVNSSIPEWAYNNIMEDSIL